MCTQKLLHTHLVVLARAVNCCNLDCYARSCYVTGCQTLRWWSGNGEVVRYTCTHTHAKTRIEASERKAQRRRQANTRQITPNKRGKTLARAHTHTHTHTCKTETLLLLVNAVVSRRGTCSKTNTQARPYATHRQTRIHAGQLDPTQLDLIAVLAVNVKRTCPR